ncbi:hypothetical protein BOTBODRAFT_35164 [Botryobasidium botryosum FD-172 SS1]|uniref:Peptidase C14 caspase domain-containing protein n=1 Tax=Botryobasidium botryosum (strain FD-172 SS1) TaxID=930990 RepID=A0A067MJI6_BOTB1|nr:hypothetical protein BOTBODRAFT_35164 [Botryobasidium botryosum FD-172 SS1]
MSMAPLHSTPTLLSSDLISTYPTMYSRFSRVCGGVQTALAHAGAICSYAGGLVGINKCTIELFLAGWLPTSINVQPKYNTEPKRKALLIGVNHPNGSRSGKDRVCDWCPDYDNYRRIHIDTMRMRDLLTTRYGYAKGDIHVLLDGDGANDDSGKVFTLQPTKATVEACLRCLIEDAGPGDRYFLYFAGHGAYDDDIKDEIDGKDEAIFNHDSYVNQEIVNSLMQSVTRPMPAGSKLIALFDCCHSGTALDLASTNGPDIAKAFTAESAKRHEKGRLGDPCIYTADPKTFVVSQCSSSRNSIGAPHSSAEIVTISACLDSKLAYETMGGWLTDSLVETLQTKPRQTYRELFSGTSMHLNYVASRINELQAEKVFPPQTIYLHSQDPLDLDRMFPL